MKHNTQVDFLGRRRLYFSGIILCIFVWPGDVFYRNIDEEIHVKPSAQKNDLQTFCLQATEGIKEAFEEKTKQSAAHYESSKVIYNSSFIIH